MEIKAKSFRVYLSGIGMSDADEIARLANDRDVANGLSPDFPFPYRREYAVSFVEGATQLMMMGKGFHFSIRKMDDGKLVGVCGSASYSQVSKKCEIGFWLGKEHWGKGYGPEAVRLLVHFCFIEMGINRVFAEVHLPNERSVRLLEKLGFTKEGELRDASVVEGKFVDDVVLGLLKKDYKDKLDVKIKK